MMDIRNYFKPTSKTNKNDSGSNSDSGSDCNNGSTTKNKQITFELPDFLFTSALASPRSKSADLENVEDHDSTSANDIAVPQTSKGGRVVPLDVRVVSNTNSTIPPSVITPFATSPYKKGRRKNQKRNDIPFPDDCEHIVQTMPKPPLNHSPKPSSEVATSAINKEKGNKVNTQNNENGSSTSISTGLEDNAQNRTSTSTLHRHNGSSVTDLPSSSSVSSNSIAKKKQEIPTTTPSTSSADKKGNEVGKTSTTGLKHADDNKVPIIITDRTASPLPQAKSIPSRGQKKPENTNDKKRKRAVDDAVYFTDEAHKKRGVLLAGGGSSTATTEDGSKVKMVTPSTTREHEKQAITDPGGTNDLELLIRAKIDIVNFWQERCSLSGVEKKDATTQLALALDELEELNKLYEEQVSASLL